MSMLLAKTGVTKAGYLLKKTSANSNQWRSYFFILNDHSLSHCSEKHNFERPDGSLLLTAATRVYHQDVESDSTVLRLETGCEVLLLKAKDETETKEWQRAIHANVSRLSELARGQFRVKAKGRSKESVLMLHRECITSHPSFSDTLKVLKIYPLTESSSVDVKGGSIEFKTSKRDEALSMTAKNDIEHQHWCYALDLAISRLKKEASNVILPPPSLPIHSGSFLSLDPTSSKWTKKYIVLTEECLYVHAHRRLGFDTPQKYDLTPNCMVFTTTLREHSFELVLFSESIHLAASSDSERAEVIFILQKLIPKSSYNTFDPLQVASLEKDAEMLDVRFESETSPGVMLERRGNWAIAALVSESLSRKVCQSSVLARIEGEPVTLQGFDAVVTKLGFWKAPLTLSFLLSPQKMGWLILFAREQSRSWLSVLSPNQTASTEAVLSEKVYATLSSGVVSLYTVKRDGKSKKRAFSLYGSAVGLVDSNSVGGNKHCFRILDGTETVILQAQSHDDMMDWATALAQTVSMENGGGLLLDKEKKTLEKDGFFVGESSFPTQAQNTYDFHRLLGTDTAKSIVFTKPIKEETPCAMPEKQAIQLEPISEGRAPNNLNTTQATETTGDTTFTSLDPVDLSQSMEDFARNFFASKDGSSEQMPVQALRSSEQWLSIDKVSSTSSGSEIFDKVSAFGESADHITESDFEKLLQFTSSLAGNAGDKAVVQ